MAVLGGMIVAGILLDWAMQPYVIEHVNAQEPEATTTAPVEVQIILRTNWTPELIERRIRETFPEDPETALKIAKCESGLDADVQSYHVLNGKRERSFGVFQIHEPSWHKVALRLGYDDYQTDPGDNIAMARYIYDNAGKKWKDWSCYTKRMI